jgi:hypothetical protein
MLYWFLLSIKYQIWPLPKDPADLRKLAIDLRVPLAYSWTSDGLNTSLVRKSIRERLKSMRKDASYVLFLLVPIFSITAILAVLLVWIAGVLSW